MPAGGTQVGLRSAGAGAEAEHFAAPGLHRVVRRSVVVRIEKLLEPLQKLKVVLESALDQLVDGYDLLNIPNVRTINQSFPFQSDKLPVNLTTYQHILT